MSVLIDGVQVQLGACSLKMVAVDEILAREPVPLRVKRSVSLVMSYLYHLQQWTISLAPFRNIKTCRWHASVMPSTSYVTLE